MNQKYTMPDTTRIAFFIAITLLSACSSPADDTKKWLVGDHHNDQTD